MRLLTSDSLFCKSFVNFSQILFCMLTSNFNLHVHMHILHIYIILLYFGGFNCTLWTSAFLCCHLAKQRLLTGKPNTDLLSHRTAKLSSSRRRHRLQNLRLKYPGSDQQCATGFYQSQTTLIIVKHDTGKTGKGPESCPEHTTSNATNHNRSICVSNQIFKLH